MIQEQWARCSLRIRSDKLSNKEISARLGCAGDERGPCWTLDIGDDSTIHLNDQLSIVKSFLEGHLPQLRELVSNEACEINVSVGWTPRHPQDGILLDPDLVKMMAEIRGYILLDTYAE
jgi:hypothetical protein